MRNPAVFVVLFGILWGGPAAAGAPVAIVEEAEAPSTNLQAMDYLSHGMTFSLGKDETITIAYFQSCAIERITGGKIKVGFSRSKVSMGGRVVRERVPCDGGQIVLTQRQTEQEAGAVFRALEEADQKAPMTVYSTAPVFVFSKPAEQLLIQRLDPGTSEKLRLTVTGSRLDLADRKIWLAKGGTYRASTKSSAVEFKVSDTATASNRFIVSRLIGL